MFDWHQFSSLDSFYNQKIFIFLISSTKKCVSHLFLSDMFLMCIHNIYFHQKIKMFVYIPLLSRAMVSTGICREIRKYQSCLVKMHLFCNCEGKGPQGTDKALFIVSAHCRNAVSLKNFLLPHTSFCFVNLPLYLVSVCPSYYLLLMPQEGRALWLRPHLCNYMYFFYKSVLRVYGSLARLFTAVIQALNGDRKYLVDFRLCSTRKTSSLTSG